MMPGKKYFGTDGVRGPVDGPLINPKWIEKFGCAVGLMFQSTSKQKPFVLIGQDSRESGKILEAALQKGLTSVGVDVVFLGILSTPAIAFLTKKLQANAGIVISASHNPYTDNGVKVIGQNGFKLPDEWELSVEKKIDDAFFSVPTKERGHVRWYENALSDYIEHCQTIFGKPLALNDYKIVVDCANGATSLTSSKLFEKLHANMILIHATPNGKNINDHCGATSTASLKEKVLSEKADCGIAFDGDGDRLIMVDHAGEIVDGDEILGIIALNNPNCKAVVGTLMSNLGLEQALKAQHILFERASVGDRYVLEQLQKNNWTLGGEGSGHIVNLQYATTGDGIITALQVLKIMHDTKKSLHELKKIMHKRPQILINVPTKNPQLFSTKPDISDAVKQAEKKLGDRGRILLRASGTESCVRVMVEGNDKNETREIAEILVNVVKHALA